MLSELIKKYQNSLRAGKIRRPIPGLLCLQTQGRTNHVRLRANLTGASS